MHSEWQEIFEQAGIPEWMWECCHIADGMIYTPEVDEHKNILRTGQEVYAQWLKDAQAPAPTAPTVEEQLQSLAGEITDLQLALVEAYEQAEAQDTNAMLALTEIYEQLLAMQGGGETNG